MSSASDFVERLEKVLIDPLVSLLFVAALLLFTWGAVQFILNADNEEAKKKGKSHMIWAIIGLVIIVGGMALIEIILNTFGVSAPSSSTGF